MALHKSSYPLSSTLFVEERAGERRRLEDKLAIQ